MAANFTEPGALANFSRLDINLDGTPSACATGKSGAYVDGALVVSDKGNSSGLSETPGGENAARKRRRYS